MEYRHPEHGHELDGQAHEDCLELAEDLLADLEAKEYPEHVIDIVKGIVGELEEYEQIEKDEEGREVVDEDDMSDEDLEKAKNDEMYGEDKPKLVIRIKP